MPDITLQVPRILGFDQPLGWPKPFCPFGSPLKSRLLLSAEGQKVAEQGKEQQSKGEGIAQAVLRNQADTGSLPDEE